ncbi:hypothetical protein QBC35DRAFT_509362 [Podospora australis]|uniref:Protein SQS1 n=1 Tax=Podospora australis TaxID=1536484 RepID=A0AAN6WJG4_9PEZI|nr:hypothetical protein QBC35DRAFT_509362 [Podospora australis]
MPSKRGKRVSAGPKSAHHRFATAAQSSTRNFSLTTSSKNDARPTEFSMRDEVRNTQSHHLDSSWTSGSVKLRLKPVKFVSAGHIEPLKDLQIGHLDAGMKTQAVQRDTKLRGGSPEAEIPEGTSMEVTELIEVITTVEQEIPTQTTSPKDPLETAGGQTAKFTKTQAVTETEGLFFFDVGGKNDKRNDTHPLPLVPSPRSSFGVSDSSDEVILFRGRSTNTRTQPEDNRIERSVAPSRPADVILHSSFQAPVVSSNLSGPRDQNKAFPRRRGKPAKSQGSRSQNTRKPVKDELDDEDDEILADYIANMTANGEGDFIARQLETFNSRRDLGGDHFALNLGSGDENNLPVVEDLSGEKGTDSVGFGSSDSEDQDDALEEEEGDDEDFADVDDETLARLLSKQEELGLGTEELVLFDSLAVGKSKGKNKNSKRTPRGDSSFSNALGNVRSVVDAFENADLLDWGQTAPRKRRSKQPPTFNVSDSEIEEALKTAWSRDRERKKGRKQEREALRAQGLLRKGATCDDLHVKYPTGFKLEDFKTEIASFLVGSDERLEFPPLDKHARMVLHQIAGKFNVKSKSTGNGQARRPVLYRTKRTVVYQSTQIAEATRQVDAAARRVGRKYFPRADVETGANTYKEAYGSAGTRVSMKALVLREGEIVGASAPELGQENKGRAMLEKMGWSKGMGLGTTENKGILEPVAQVVKKSKAGLGTTYGS